MNLHQFEGAAAANLTERLSLVPAAPELSPPHLPKAIIFEVEGTLVDSVLPALCAWQDALADHGFCFTTSELHRCSGLGAEEMLTALLPAPVHGAVREPIARRQQELYRGKYLDRVAPFDGVADALHDLKAAGVKIALATSCDRKLLDRYLSLLKCPASALDAIVCARDAARTRPDPAVLEAALSRLAMPASANVWAVGATPADAQAAMRAGLTPAGVLTGYFARETLHAAGCHDVCETAVMLMQALTAATMPLDAGRAALADAAG
jgi:phosphoglycolate phosphatase-like HAD superfamily hydrolase